MVITMPVEHYYSMRYEKNVIFSKRQAESRPLNPAMGSGERYDLPKLGPGRLL